MGGTVLIELIGDAKLGDMMNAKKICAFDMC